MQTFAPKSGSPVIGAGDTATCPATDERGYLRPAGSCDLGALQSNGTPPPPPPGRGGSGPSPAATLSLGQARVAHKGVITLAARTNAAGTLTAEATVSITTRHGHHKRATRVLAYGHGSTHVSAAGMVTLTIRPTRSAKRQLHTHARVRIEITVTLHPDGGGAPVTGTAHATT
jgi:hypothetical protein